LARRDRTQQVRLALAERRRDGNRPVAENNLAAALGNVEQLRVRRLDACDDVTVAVDQKIRTPRHEMAVAMSQPSLLPAPGFAKALVDRPGGGGDQLQAPRMRDPPEARQVDQSDCFAGYQVVHRSAGANPVVMAFVEMLEGEHLKGVVCCQRSPDPVRAVGCLAVLRTLAEIHLSCTLLRRSSPTLCRTSPDASVTTTMPRDSSATFRAGPSGLG
jgi:hypothetical protein